MKILERVWTSNIFLSAVLLCTGLLFGTHRLWLLIREEHLLKERNTAFHSWHGEGPAVCHGPRTALEHMRYRMHDRMRHALKQIDLTESQKTAIHQIRISLKKDMIMKRADLKIAKLELREQLRKEPVDMSTVESQVKKLEGLKTEMILNAIKAGEEIRSTLTTEQRKKLAELLQLSRRSYHGAHPGA